MLWITLNKKCFLANEPNEMTALFNNTIKYFCYFHLNMPSLPFHFEEFSALVNTI